MSTLVRGTIILTLATIISKVLGFIYVVPFTALVGTQGYILFEYAYKPYVIILSFATLGVPLAVSKFVSKYNELGDYEAGKRLFKSGLLFLTITGSICFFVLFYFAPSIASLLIDPNDPTGNSMEDVVFVIRMVSFALIIVPPMAIARGFFQGHHSMGPTALSQVVEQLVRIVFILLGAYIAIHLLGKSVSTAVGIATFAAFIGAIGGSIVLYRYWKRAKPGLDKLSSDNNQATTVPLPTMYKELTAYAIPFVIAGLAIPLYQTIDTFTINQAMMASGTNQLEAETVNSIVALVTKIIMIPVSLATALGLTLLPIITKSYVAKDHETLKSQVSKTFLIICFLTLPCVALLMSLATPSYSFLFGSTHATTGGELMLWYAPTAIILSFFIVTNSILQGMDRYKFVIISMFVGLIVKGATNFILVAHYSGVGSVISTNLGLTISIALNLWALKKYSEFRFNSIGSSIAKSVTLTLFVGMLVWLIDSTIHPYIHHAFENHYIQTGLRLLIGGTIGSIVYITISYKIGLLQTALGEDILKKFSSITLPYRLLLKNIGKH